MILEEETFKKFGYSPSDLKPQSCKRILAACDDCGKIRETSKNSYRTFCVSCSVKGEKNGKWKGGGIKQICLSCGKEFLARPYSIKKGKGKFCSRKCAVEYQIKKNHPLWNKVKRICQTCGKEFEVPPSIIKKGGGKYCSHFCARKSRTFPKHHTKPELIFEGICKRNDLLFKYTGDGSFWIGKNPAINPDFIECNGKKIVVEIFGDYWHSPLLNPELKEDRTLPYRKKILKKYGWKLIVFWGSDLLRKDAEQFVLSKLR